MARRRDRQPNQRKAYSEHHERVEAYTQEVNRLFDEMVAQAVHLVGIFEGMEDTPALERALQGLKKTFAERMLANISLGMMNEWSAASRVQDELLRRVLGERFPEKYTLNRPQALEAFLKRKTAGLSLSQRIWKLAGQAEEELTTAIAVGLSDGLSAHELSREVRKYLQDPDKLFRRVRDDEGDLKLSKPAKAYRPGQGVYRSSHKNALRLTRTEINMAYRRGEQSRWQDMDFVVGYEVKRSGTGYPCPVCEALAGKYPKDFVWSTWHPHCRCYAIPILKTEDELFEDSDKPSINEVKEPHEGFQRWVKEQEGRIKLYAQRGTLPLFLKENKQALQLLKGEKWSNSKTPSLLERAKARQAKRTPQQIEDIKKRAWTRQLDRSEISTLTQEEKTAIVKNWIEIEEKLGVTKGRMMSVQEADKQSANPNHTKKYIADPNGVYKDRYGRYCLNPKYNELKAKPYSVNCATCAPAYALRLRGFDITAKGNVKNSRSLNEWVSKQHSFDLWQNIDGTASNPTLTYDWMLIKGYKRMTSKRYREYFEETCQEEGVYILTIGWKKGGGHATILQRFSDGNLSYIEPQSYNELAGVRRTIDELCEDGTATPIRTRGILRVDNKLFNPKYVELFNK